MFDSDLFGHPLEAPRAPGPMGDVSVVPPFTVLDGRAGYWLERKAAWLRLGIQSELGRSQFLGAGGGGDQGTMTHITRGTAPAIRAAFESMSQSSVFDPVLTEVLLRWFCPAGGVVLDPFAGGSVRGIVAARLVYRYLGVDLSATQIASNREQARRILADRAGPQPEWIVGESREVLPSLPDDYRADCVLTCPPYGDLETYSTDPRDLSTLPHEEFLQALGTILRAALRRLWPDRFAALVLGDIRDEHGTLRNLLARTLDEATRGTGAVYYNDAVYLQPLGTLPLRSGLIFSATRKLGRAHQIVLVLCKGDGARAASALRTASALARTTPSMAGHAAPRAATTEADAAQLDLLP